MILLLCAWPVHGQDSAEAEADPAEDTLFEHTSASTSTVPLLGEPLESLPQTTGTISGTVTWSGVLPVNEPFEVNVDERFCAPGGFLANDQTGIDPETLAVANAVVWLESTTARDLPTSAMPQRDFPIVRLELRDCRFDPPVVVLPEGGRLWIKSRDAIVHQLYSLQGEKRSRTMQLGFTGALETLRLREPGIYRFRCERHPWERAVAVVGKNIFYTVTDGDGGFSFQNVPYGTYRVRVWHDGTYVSKEVRAGLVTGYKFSDGGQGHAQVRVPQDSNRSIRLILREDPPKDRRPEPPSRQGSPEETPEPPR